MKTQKLRILVISGGGGGAHALVWKLAQSARTAQIYVAGGHAGMQPYATLLSLATDDISSLRRFAKSQKINLTVAGALSALQAGVVDQFHQDGLPILGPWQAMLPIQISKIFLKELMRLHSIPTLPFRIFERPEQTLAYCRQQEFPLVVKVEGLTHGEGVFICHHLGQVTEILTRCMKEHFYGQLGERIIIEQFVRGPDIAIPLLVDDTTMLQLPPLRVYRHLYDGDKGPVTSGMGAYCPVAVPRRKLDAIEREILVPLIHALKRSGRAYQGLLQLNIKLTERGPRLISCYVVPGELELQCLLARWEVDLPEVLLALLNSSLENIAFNFSPQTSLALMITNPSANALAEPSLLSLPEERVLIFQGQRDNGQVISVTTLGENLQNATDLAYETIAQLRYPTVQWRNDIGSREVTRTP